MLLPAIAKGRTAYAPGNPDLPHSFTYTGDMARTMVTLAADDRAYGHAWHAPTPPAVTIRDLANRYTDLTGQPRLKLRALPRFAMRTAGLVVPMAREMAEMDYQFYAPFHLDSTQTEETFGLKPTDLDVPLTEIATSVNATLARRMN
ncbi:hypothetical protein [Actinoplanes subtropicus]|uniref:hypothetical protein n=1 Tax=Actinoplanes subtropicus TaxID=543632 RepID=UPI000AB1E85A|nr:hypothetical protein [Actinoplanes subtropicus]